MKRNRFILSQDFRTGENGKLKNKIVRIADKELIKKLSNNYMEHKRALGDLGKINAEEIKLLKSLLKSKTIRYE